MSRDSVIEQRFDELVATLRGETPATPPTLRDRVAATTASHPPQARRFTGRRILGVAVPAAAAASLVAAVAVGLNTAARPGPTDDGGPAASADRRRAVEPKSPETARAEEALRSDSRPATSAGALPGPTAGRAQDYTASVRLLVDGTDDLSTTTQRALRTARRLGGHVVSLEYRTPEPGEGTAAVRLRIPASRVQAAIVEFSGLGRILAQETRIADLQQPLDDLTRRIRRLERRAAELRGAERARVLAEIAALRRQRLELGRRAAYATVDLALTTHDPAKREAAPGRLERALDDATGVLAAELAIGAYALIVASPLLVLLAAAFFGNRAYRRYADQRLLERA